MTDNERTWMPVCAYDYGYEADLAIARLDAEGIMAVKRGDSFTGIICPGYDKHTPYAVQVLVPSDVIDEARRVLNPVDDRSNGS